MVRCEGDVRRFCSNASSFVDERKSFLLSVTVEATPSPSFSAFGARMTSNKSDSDTGSREHVGHRPGLPSSEHFCMNAVIQSLQLRKKVSETVIWYLRTGNLPLM